MNAIDTNVTIYAIDDSNLEKQKIALALITNLYEAKETVFLSQFAAEFPSFLHKVEKKGTIDAEGVYSQFSKIKKVVSTCNALGRTLRVYVPTS